MSNLEAAETRLSFDDILEAVQDSRRGRWFLQEYESRIKARDSQTILSAISRLEHRMELLGNSSNASPDDLQRVRSAIANARNDLLKLGLGKEAMSAEGRLFAEIAEMARKSMPVAVDSNAGIVRTLQLVAEIDSAMSNPAPAPETEDKGAKFFAADAALFERGATASKPTLVATPPVAEPVVEAPKAAVQPEPPKPEKKEEAAPLGARLVIRKAKPEAVAETVVEPAPAPAPVIDQAAQFDETSTVETQAEMPAIDNPRIVIIRRKAEDMPEVELTPRQDAESAA